MTVFFKWSDDYSLGVSILDQQHQYMFRLANEIQYSSPTEFNEYTKKLYQYTKYHFDEEEQFYKGIETPLFKEHLRLHNQLLDSLVSIVEEDLSTYEKFERLKTFYLNWLVDHILYQDRKVLRDINPKL